MSARTGPLTFHLRLKLRLRQVLTMWALLAVGAAAFAQSDPPSRVGRVSEIAGSVFLASDDTDSSWQPIGINYPVTIGDSVWVSQDGRAEIDFGAGQVRLSDEANVHFSQLDDRQFSAYLASGRAILRLRALDPGESAKLDTANAQIDILRPGNYRVETTADGVYTRLVVRDGEAQLHVADRTVTVLTGQTAVIDGNSYGASLVVREGYGTDGFDAWSTDRDRRWEAGSLSSRYVSNYVPGVNDLDDYGAWETTATYGAVWYPRTVAVDWVPYRDGSWTFVRPWGWTWVDSARWGWAPFHYGRWVRLDNRWGWCPGTFVSHPIYAPALVAWYGGPSGTSWSMGFSGPTFGWVPLAWGEPYWPHYRYGTDYWRLINRPYAVNVYRVPAKPLPTFSYANARIPGAVTAVSGVVFTGRRPIDGNHYTVPPATLAGATITTTPLAVRPMTKPLAVDNLPRGIPARAGSPAGRGSNVRPDFGTPGAAVGRPFPGQPGGVAGTISEPAPGGGRSGVNSPALVGRPTISEPAPTVGRPTVREPARYNPGLSPAPQSLMPAPRPAPPVIREPAPMAAPYNPGLSPGQSYTPPPRPAAPVVREPAPMMVPAPTVAPAPVPGKSPPGNPAAGGRPTEPQIQLMPAPAPGPRSVAPTIGRLNDGGSSARMRAQRPAPRLENGAIVTSPQYQATAHSRREVPREVREYRREQHRQPPQPALQQALRDTPAAAPQNQRWSESPQHAKAQAEGIAR
jgi:hypothetical protein